jgi:hypothetical protein
MNKHKLTLTPILLGAFLPLVAFGQWTFKTVDNGFDEPYKIAYTAKNNDALLKLEPVEVEVALPKKYPLQPGMHYFETSYEHSITGGESIDLTSGSLRNQGRVFSGEKLVIVGQTSIETNGTTKKYYLLFDRYKKVFCQQEQINFTIPTSIQSFDLQNQKEIDSLIEVAKIYSEQCTSENTFLINRHCSNCSNADIALVTLILIIILWIASAFRIINHSNNDSDSNSTTLMKHYMAFDYLQLIALFSYA